MRILVSLVCPRCQGAGPARPDSDLPPLKKGEDEETRPKVWIDNKLKNGARECAVCKYVWEWREGMEEDPKGGK